MMVTLLQNVLESISMKNKEELYEKDFTDLLCEAMKGWAIEIWDCDDYTGTELVSSVADYILSEIEEGRTNIQHCEWCTNNEDTYYYVVASIKD